MKKTVCFLLLLIAGVLSIYSESLWPGIRVGAGSYGEGAGFKPGDGYHGYHADLLLQKTLCDRTAVQWSAGYLSNGFETGGLILKTEYIRTGMALKVMPLPYVIIYGGFSLYYILSAKVSDAGTAYTEVTLDGDTLSMTWDYGAQVFFSERMFTDFRLASWMKDLSAGEYITSEDEYRPAAYEFSLGMMF